MKKLFTLLSFASVLATGISSCKKDHTEENKPVPPVAQIKELTSADESLRFEYSADNTVSKVFINSELSTGGDDVTYTVAYNQGKISTLTGTNGQKLEAVYQNNKLTRADIIVDNERIGYTNYEYENNVLARATLYFGETPSFEPLTAFIFTNNAAGNVAEQVVMLANGEPGKLVRGGSSRYQYDTKSNPLYEHRDLLALFWQSVSKNNVTVEDEFTANNVAENKTTYTYTYKSNGLPEKAAMIEGLPGQQQTLKNLTFSYR